LVSLFHVSGPEFCDCIDISNVNGVETRDKARSQFLLDSCGGVDTEAGVDKSKVDIVSVD
jgi:hypothetical protein